ncbi:MAG: winged helix-turn-helix domain-containing protein [Phycisphaerales bacterium JB040]
MGRVFEIRTPGQLREINSPARLGVLEAMMDGARSGGPGQTAREIGERAGVSPESAHYHLGRLEAAGLVERAGLRQTGARPERLYTLTCERLELAPARRGRAWVRELVRGVRLMLNRAEREFEAAAPEGAFASRPTVSRSVGWMTADEADRARALTREIEELVHASDARSRDEGLGGRERVAVTIVTAPVERGRSANPVSPRDGKSRRA